MRNINTACTQGCNYWSCRNCSTMLVPQVYGSKIMASTFSLKISQSNFCAVMHYDEL